MSDKGKIVAHRRDHSGPARASSSTSTVTTKVRENSYEMQKSTRTRRDVYKDASTGTTHRLSHTQKTGEYVDRRSGSSGQYKEERYKSSLKVGNGKTYEFEVRIKEKTTSHKSSSSRGKVVITSDNHHRRVKH